MGKLNKKKETVSVFAQKVYAQLKMVPKGKVTTYGLLAQAIGQPQAARAVGGALNRNPFAPKVPCHRVVSASGALGGFAHGSKKKAIILAKEGVKFKKGKAEGFSDKLFRF